MSLHGRIIVFAQSAAMQMRVVGALLMRELHTRYGRDNVGYLWMILEPMLLAAAVSTMHANEKIRFASDIRPVPFAIVGYSSFIIFRGIFTRAEGALESNMPLLYHRMVTIFDILLSRALLESAGASVTMIILLLFATSLGVADLPYRPLDLLLGIFLMTWFSFAASMLCCAITHESRLAERLVHPFTYILMPLAGTFYMLKWIPEPYRSYLWYLPLVQIFEQTRYGEFETATNDYVSLVYVIGCCLFMTWTGMLALRVTRRHVHLH